MFQYSKPTGTFTGIVDVNADPFSTPTNAFEIAQDESLYVSAAQYYDFENVRFTFSSWSPGGGTNRSTYVKPDGATSPYSITANYMPVPLPPLNLSVGGSAGSHPRMTWTSHSASSGVTEYQIWRKVKPQNQQEQSPVLKATVSRTITSYTDNEYTITSGYTQDLVSYDVRARYNAGGVSVYANPNYQSVFAEEFYGAPKDEAADVIFAPTEYVLSAHPNPFNPNTVISCDLPEPATVRVEVFDAAGRRVSEILDSFRVAGRHYIQWRGEDAHGRSSASGAYYCRMTAIPVGGNGPVVRTFRLLLLK